jgi:hypothetical protein
MNFHPRTFLIIIAIILFLSSGCAPTANSKSVKHAITIGTGGEKGMYYPTGRAICSTLNKSLHNHGIFCSAQVSKGSVDNIQAVERGDLQFGIAKSDWIYKAYRGSAYWKGFPQRKLRTIFSIHPESIHLISDNSIEMLQDLRRKTVSIGKQKSMVRIDALAVLDAYKINQADVNVKSLQTKDAVTSFRKKEIDAFFHTAGDPSGTTHTATNTRKSRLISIEGPEVDQIIAQYPYYEKTVIPISWYHAIKNKEGVPSLGYKTIFFTTDDTSEEVIYQITKQIFENLEKFKKRHPAFETLTKQNMVQILNKIAPIHPGALRYYKEVGLM